MDRLSAIVSGICDSNNLTAVSTLVIAAFTAVLACVGYRQSRLIQRSIDLGRQEFIATHRPKIIVRLIEGPLVETEGGPQTVWVTVVNIGVNKARIVHWGADLARRNEGDWVAPGIDLEVKTIAPVLLVSGQCHSFKVTAKFPYTDTQIAADAFDEELCAVGAIRYADDSDIVRETGFFRVYDPASKAFISSKNPENEYQD